LTVRVVATNGALWMLVAAAGFTVVPVAVRYMTDSIPVFEIIFWRNLLALLPSVPIMLKSGASVFSTGRLGAHALRTAFTYFAMLTYFWGISVVPLAQATAIHFLIPIFTALSAVFFLGERATWGRGGALLVGLGGALLVVRPGFTDTGIYSFSVMLSALFYAGSWLMVKRLSSTESASATTFYMNLLLLPVSFVPAVFFWAPLSVRDIPAMLALGLGGWLAHYAQARAFATADMGVVAPLDFLRLPFVAFAAYLMFDQVPESFVWAGGLIIIAAATYVLRYEGK
jgi:drug/metabolite transporter (DMT)-like permease